MKLLFRILLEVGVSRVHVVVLRADQGLAATGLSWGETRGLGAVLGYDSMSFSALQLQPALD